MHGIIFAVAVLVSAGAASPAPGRPSEAVLTAPFTFQVPAGRTATARARTFRSTQPAAAKRFSKTEKVIAVAAGISLGWVIGATVGASMTANRDNPDDDISPMRGMIVGAPIGAVAGAILGYKLTK